MNNRGIIIAGIVLLVIVAGTLVVFRETEKPASPDTDSALFNEGVPISGELVFLLDPSDSFYKKIGGFSMPETIFVDTDGTVRIHKRGPMELAEMREHVSRTLRAPSDGVTYRDVPDFSLSDYTGNTITPDDFPGKALVINVWATWCPFCVEELPDFARLQKEFADDIVVIAIDRGESLEKAREYTDTMFVLYAR